MDFDNTGVDHSNGHHDDGIAKREVTVVEVRNPVNRNEDSLKLYTDYEVCIKTTSKAFIIPQSSVRRRYSDFLWLRNWLKQNDAFSHVKTPKLPPKKLVGRTDPSFIQKRMRGLQKFLRKIIEHNVFLSDKALHLFLQSPMKVKEIESYLNGKNSESFTDNSDILVSHFEKENNQSTAASSLKSISENMAIAKNETPEETEESCYERGSSYSSSITSSLLDSFEAINVDDCIEEEYNETIASQQKIIEHTIKEEESKSEEDDLDSLDGLAENKVYESLHLLLEDNKEQCGSDNSLAECDQLE